VRIAGPLRRVARSSGRQSSTWRLKKVLLSLIVLGGLSCFTLTSAFALLNGESRNTGSSISSGTLTFSNKVDLGSLCYSYSGPASPGNGNTGCDPLFSSATQMYPGTAATSRVTIANNGSLDAKDLSVYMPSCTAVTTPTAPSPGGADPCGVAGAQFYIQETDSSFNATNCKYPAAAGACTFVANTLFFFKSSANSAPTAFDLGSGPAHGLSRYFVIGMQLPTNAGNALQGEEALFGLTWRMTT
jgi:hypothetical protein